MRYLKLFENFHDIDSLCKKYEIKNYTISDDGSVHVDGNVPLSYREFENIPINFGIVRGHFECGSNKLTSLEGCPKEVGGTFICSSNKLTSLKGCPKKVGGYFNCSFNYLLSLEGCSQEVGSFFDCSFNQLKLLKGSPREVYGNFKCGINKLTSLEGCPKKISGDFECSNNELTIIDYLPEWIEGQSIFYNNQIRDIKVEDKNYRFFGECYLFGNPIDYLFEYWKGDLQNFILDLQIEDFIRDDGKSVDITRFEYALDGKKYDKKDIKNNYKLIYKE